MSWFCYFCGTIDDELTLFPKQITGSLACPVLCCKPCWQKKK